MQQINLLNPQLLTPKVAFSSKTMSWMLLAVAALGFAVYFWVIAGARDAESQLERVQTERDALQARMDSQVQPGEDGLTPADKHAQTVAAARQRVAELQKRQTALGGVPETARFSSRLRALANESKSGVWLTGIEFSESGFRLEGRALQPERIPDYLQSLSRQAALASLVLSGVAIVPVEAMTDDKDSARLRGVAFVINPATESE